MFLSSLSYLLYLLNFVLFCSCVRRNKGETVGSKMAHLLERYVPAIRVCSICFILYVSFFWVRFQIGDGGDGGREGGRRWRRGLLGGGGRNKEDIMRLYGVRATRLTFLLLLQYAITTRPPPPPPLPPSYLQARFLDYYLLHMIPSIND